MKRETDDRNVLEKFAIEFCRIIETHCKYIVVSGFLAIATGRTRGTEDIDMIIPRLSQEEFRLLHKDLTANGFEAIQSQSSEELFAYLDDRLSIRYIRIGEPVPEMEVKFAKDEIDNLQLQTRTKIPLTGLNIWFSSIEVNIAFKEELLGSDKDLEDARHLRKVFSSQIDENEVARIKRMLKKRK